MIHQPSGGFQGQVTDIQIHAEEIIRTRQRLNELYCQHTGKDMDTIEKAMERDNFMDAAKAKAFGLIDEVVDKRPAGESPSPLGRTDKSSAGESQDRSTNGRARGRGREGEEVRIE